MNERIVLITGASSGVGRDAAESIAARGYTVYAASRNTSAAYGERIRPLKMDVTSPDSIRSALDVVDSEFPGCGLYALIHNAGTVVPGPLECLDENLFSRHFQVNVMGVHSLTRAALRMLRKGNGRIIMIGSINGRIAKPYIGAYSASKFALRAMADAWRMELEQWNIHVSMIEPGSIKTPLWGKARIEMQGLIETLDDAGRENYLSSIETVMKAAEKREGRGLPAARVVKSVIRALESDRPKASYLIGASAVIQTCLASVLPRSLLNRLIISQFGFSGKRDDS